MRIFGMRTIEREQHILRYQRASAEFMAAWRAQVGGWHEREQLPILRIVLTSEPAHDPIYPKPKEK